MSLETVAGYMMGVEYGNELDNIFTAMYLEHLVLYQNFHICNFYFMAKTNIVFLVSKQHELNVQVESIKKRKLIGWMRLDHIGEYPPSRLSPPTAHSSLLLLIS